MSGWQYKRENGEIVGILSEDEIKRCAERGGLALDTLILHEDKTRGEWVAAGRISALRKRIEESEQRQQAVETPPPQPTAGYVPPRPPKASVSQFKAIFRGVQQGSVHLGQKIAAVAEYLTARKPLHVCLKCEGEFAKYGVPGQCPLCGEWAVLACEGCGLESGAKRFVENGFKCPRCGAKVTL